MNAAQVDQITQYLDIDTPLPTHADLAFVFGTRHPEPAHMVADLLKRRVVKRVALTGGDNRITDQNEAHAPLQILLSAGIPRHRIILEDQSSNTLENVLYALPEITAYVNPENITSVVVLTKWYHCRRAIMTLKRHFPSGIRYYVLTYEPKGITRVGWHLNATAHKRVLKEWEAIPKYLDKGDIAEIRKEGQAYT